MIDVFKDLDLQRLLEHCKTLEFKNEIADNTSIVQLAYAPELSRLEMKEFPEEHPKRKHETDESSKKIKV